MQIEITWMHIRMNNLSLPFQQRKTLFQEVCSSQFIPSSEPWAAKREASSATVIWVFPFSQALCAGEFLCPFVLKISTDRFPLGLKCSDPLGCSAVVTGSLYCVILRDLSLHRLGTQGQATFPPVHSAWRIKKSSKPDLKALKRDRV